MTFRPHPAEEGRFSWLERWAPAEAVVWTRWRQSLSADQRAGALLPLQAALSGLMAFRHLENHPPAPSVADFRPYLHAVRVTCAWALGLAAELGAERAGDGRLHAARITAEEPSASLSALARSLDAALRVSERLLDLPGVDAGAFAASCDLLLRDLSRNSFFRPPDPLEFSNVTELIGPERFPAHLASFGDSADKTTMIIAFLSLLRSHRFLGIADGQMSEDDGIYRAHVVLAGARRELRTLTRFLLVQGGEAVEALAMEVHDMARTQLDEPLPATDCLHGLAAPSERMRNGIREVRRTVKGSAKHLRDLSAPRARGRTDRSSELVQRNLQQDIWAFRFIVRGFLAKASAAPVDGTCAAADLEFAAEFVRHFRQFGPRLAKGTGYGRRAPLVRAVTALSRRDETDERTLGIAASECMQFVEHLDRALESPSSSSEASFDRRRAAAELRLYLAGAKERFSSGPPPAGAFGAGDRDHAEAG